LLKSTVMNRTKYQILRALAVLAALASGALLSLILFWVIVGRGVIACGKGIFDSPVWPLEVLIFIGVPAGLLVGAMAMARYCSRRLLLR
jgi:hypothetical protein